METGPIDTISAHLPWNIYNWLTICTLVDCLFCMEEAPATLAGASSDITTEISLHFSGEPVNRSWYRDYYRHLE